MASLLVVTGRRAGGGAAGAVEVAIAGRQDVPGSTLCRRVVERPSTPYASEVTETFSSHERLFRRPAAIYTASTCFRRSLPIRVALVDSEKHVSAQQFCHRRRARGPPRAVDSLRPSSLSSVRVNSATQFTPSTSVAAGAPSAFPFFLPPTVTPAAPLSDAVASSFGAAHTSTLAAAPSSVAATSSAAAPSNVAASSSARLFYPPCNSSSALLLGSPRFLLLRYFTAKTASSTTETHTSSSVRSGSVGRGSSNYTGTGQSSSTGERSDNSDKTDSGPSDSKTSEKAVKSNTWLEVERMRPRAPNPWDGTYQWPAAAPDPLEIRRESFHAFMHGKQERFSRELKVFVYGWAMAALLIGLTTLTIYVMAPDDFEWVEEERARMERAKRKKAAADSFSFDLPPSPETHQVPADVPKPSA